MTEKTESTSSEKKRLYIVEDEPDILELMVINLKKAGFQVEAFTDAGPMLKLLEKQIPDLILLDLMLPDQDGLDVCKGLRNNPKFKEIPVIMVTAKTEELDVVLGLELGADDYIPKPFSPRELVARVKAVLRRSSYKAVTTSSKVTVAGILTIDAEKFEITVEDKVVQLTSTEFMILKILAGKPGWVFSREKILDLLWGDSKDVYDRTVDVHIKNLRDKLGVAGKLVRNVRGVGYKLEV